MIANYRLSAELTAIETTTDGRCVVIGTLDGCLTVLAIADPTVPPSVQFLATLPSRTRQARIPSAVGGRGSLDHQDSMDRANQDNQKDRDNDYERDIHQQYNDAGHEHHSNGGGHVKLKTAAVVAAAWAKTSTENVQKVTSKACVIS